MAAALGAVLLSVWAIMSTVAGGLGEVSGGRIAYLVAVGAAGAVLLAGWRLGALRAAGWLALAFIGYGAALQLIQAGTSIGYQHYRSWGALATAPLLPFVLTLVLQAGVVAAGIHRERAALASMTGVLTRGRWLVLAGAWIALSATLSRSPVQWLGELALASLVTLIAAATLILAVAALPDEALAQWRARFARARPGYVILPLALFATTLSAVLALTVYGAHPHIPDEVAYLIQARYFARGMLMMPAPPVPQAFELDMMTIADGRWNSLFPPGWPMVLALGAAVGMPWLVNPVLAGVGVVLTWRLVRRFYGETTGLAAAALLALSPWYLFLAMSYMSHTFTLVAALVATLAVAKLRETGRLAWALPGGVAIGLVSLVRPLDGTVLALLLGFWTLFGRRGLSRWVSTGALAIVTAATGGLQLAYNDAVTGDPRRFPLNENLDALYGEGRNRLGFGPDRGFGWEGLDPLPGHGPVDVVINSNLNGTSINVELFGWPFASLVFFLLALLALRPARPDRWMLVTLLVFFASQNLYWFSGGPDFGARYWFLMIVPLVVLTVRGAEELSRRVGSMRSAAAGRVPAFVGLASLLALLVFVPWRALDKYRGYRGMTPEPRELLRSTDPGRSLVLVRGRYFPEVASAMAYNPIDLEADAPVLAWDRGAAVRSKLLEAYADRPIWVLEGPSMTGGVYRLTGPFSAPALPPYEPVE